MPTEDWRSLDPAALDEKSLLFLLAGSIVPRPIGIVTTLGPTGIVNAAPFSSLVAISIRPPLLLLAINRHEGRHKDTARNILAGGEFVVHIPSAGMANAVALAGETFAPDVSEVQACGWTLLPSQAVRPPRIAQSPVHFECRLHAHQEVGDAPVDLVMGRVVAVHVRAAVMEEGRIDPRRLDPLAHLDPGRFATLGSIIADAKPSRPGGSPGGQSAG